jgi:uncharacterized protein YutE (UPF0331/DUF86 family)
MFMRYQEPNLKPTTPAKTLSFSTFKQHKTGVPQSSRDSFELLKKSGLISAQLALNLQKMVGLRNIAVHDYQTLNLEIVKHVVENRLSDFEEFVVEVKSSRFTTK